MSQSDLSDDDMCDDEYYGTDDEMDAIHESDYAADPEYFEFEVLTTAGAERVQNEYVAKIQSSLGITPSLAKMLLQRHQWCIDQIESRYRQDSEKFLVESHLKSAVPCALPPPRNEQTCAVCFTESLSMSTASNCGHAFCTVCWAAYIEVQLGYGHTTDIECMDEGCNVILTEDMVLAHLTQTQTREKYLRFAFTSYVNMHPCLRFCPGLDCSSIIYAKEKKERKVTCTDCKTSFCFSCGMDYHAPTHCDTIQKWLTKCKDDSETANYISANTKDCPRCHVCIEKNGGCNHIQCCKCKHDFCWVCEDDWRTHGGEYYQCSKYKANPELAAKGDKTEAREALHKYLHYYARWDNHAKSLMLEADESKKIREKIEQKVLAMEGTWIDWQYLIDATELLKRCRYTLQYTYPYAYYLKNTDSSKQLFEMLQGKLEAEVENLSWKIQKAEITDRGDLENQMNVAEKMRQNLLKDVPVVKL